MAYTNRFIQISLACRANNSSRSRKRGLNIVRKFSFECFANPIDVLQTVIARCKVDLCVLQGKTEYRQKAECCAGALEGRFISTLCRLSHAKTVLEVGMFTGTTTLAIAEVLPADGKVTAVFPVYTHARLRS